MYSIPIYQPSITDLERSNVLECLESTWISSKGRFISEFESEFAAFVGARHAATVCNGTVALHLALVALGLGPGDEVIVPSLTYVASVNAITYTGATPVFVDSEAHTWQMDPADVRRKISQRTRAIMAVHLYGHPCDLDELGAIARESNLFLVEDCAEAIGTLHNGNHVGTSGNISTFSFFGNKTITTGEGGMVVTDDESLFSRVTRLRGQGLAPNREYWHDVVGFNYRMTNICAALGVAQLQRVEAFIERKRMIAERYCRRLVGLPLSLHTEREGSRHSYWMCTLLLHDAKQRSPLREHLAGAGIETRPAFHPVHTMPMYVKPGVTLPVAEGIGARGVNLPSWPGLTDEQVDAICSHIHGYFAK